MEYFLLANCKIVNLQRCSFACIFRKMLHRDFVFWIFKLCPFYAVFNKMQTNVIFMCGYLKTSILAGFRWFRANNAEICVFQKINIFCAFFEQWLCKFVHLCKTEIELLQFFQDSWSGWIILLCPMTGSWHPTNGEKHK